MPLPLAFGTLALGLTVVAVIVVLTVVGMVSARGNKNSTFLEWDPVYRTGFREEVDNADVHTMLAEHNRRRAERGLDPQSYEEYLEGVGRD